MQSIKLILFYRTEKLAPNEDSSAVKIQKKFPTANIVKAFNTLSSYALLQQGFQGNDQVIVFMDE